MVLKWQIYSSDLNPVIGSEQKGKRPVLIISDDDYSLSMPLVSMLPITSLKPGRVIYPNEVLLRSNEIPDTGLKTDSIILAHQIRTISKERLVNHMGNIDDLQIRNRVNEALRLHLNL
jgi:mRNA interferase MazF